MICWRAIRAAIPFMAAQAMISSLVAAVTTFSSAAAQVLRWLATIPSRAARVMTAAKAATNDAYYFGANDDCDTILDAGGTDRIVFDASVLPADLRVVQMGDDLDAELSQRNHPHPPAWGAG